MDNEEDKKEDKEVELPQCQNKKRKLATKGKDSGVALCLIDNEEIEEQRKKIERILFVPMCRP